MFVVISRRCFLHGELQDNRAGHTNKAWAKSFVSTPLLFLSAKLMRHSHEILFLDPQRNQAMEAVYFICVQENFRFFRSSAESPKKSKFTAV